MPRTKVMPRGKRLPRAAAQNSAAINNVLLGKRNIGPALGAAAAAAVAGPSRLGRPVPAGGVGVKKQKR